MKYKWIDIAVGNILKGAGDMYRKENIRMAHARSTNKRFDKVMNRYVELFSELMEKE